MIKAVLFDMDGVLVDTEWFYNRRRVAFMEEKGFHFDEIPDLSGSNEPAIWQALVPDDVELRERLRVEYKHVYSPVHPVPYAELLNEQTASVMRALHERGVKCAIASSSYRELIDELVEMECLALRPFQEFSELVLTSGSAAVIRGEKQVSHRVPIVQKKRISMGSSDDSVSSEEQGLFQKLRELRTEFARAEGVPAYIIFTDASLRDMCRKKPRTMGELRQVSGVGIVKSQKYGKDFLRAIAAWQAKHPEES